jgi:hypothetical protein
MPTLRKLKLPPVKEFMNTTEEFHAFVVGFFEVLCPFPAKRPIISKELAEAIQSEYHYYLFGRGIGVIVWIIIAKLIQVIFW